MSIETEITLTKYNVTSIIGWLSLVTGITGLLLYNQISFGIWFSIFGIIVGGIVISISGPVRTTETKLVKLHSVERE